MKKLTLLILGLFVIFVAIYFNLSSIFKNGAYPFKDKQITGEKSNKTPILRFALVADSHDENELLRKSLEQAKGNGINFIIGLGDWTTIGTTDQLQTAKTVFDESGLKYYLTAGDHDLWESRNSGLDPLTNYTQIFGVPTHEFEIEKIHFVILDNSNIYMGIDESQMSKVESQISDSSKFTFVFAHKTPFHPESSHIMGQDSPEVKKQADQLTKLLEEKKVDGFFSGDIHFFARFQTPADIVKITTVGAVARQRNFQGPRFAIVTVYSDYTWEVEDVEIR